MLISDWFALAETLAIIGLLFVYSKHKQNYLTAAWILPQVFLAAYYLLLMADPHSAESLQIRIAIFRPANMMSGLCMILFLFNGTLNNAINKLLKRIGR